MYKISIFANRKDHQNQFFKKSGYKKTCIMFLEVIKV